MMTGRQFGRWTVLAEPTVLPPMPGKKTPRKLVRCRCVCGTEADVYYSGLVGKTSLSCGCWHREQSRELMRELRTTHGMTGTPTYRTWQRMLQRCYDPNSVNYQRYGARGITVCQRWRQSFVNFLLDMGERQPGMTIERKDNKKSYTPDNCKWATASEQARNRRSSRFITYNGQTKTLAGWADITGIALGTLHARLKYGWTIERTLTEEQHAQRHG